MSAQVIIDGHVVTIDASDLHLLSARPWTVKTHRKKSYVMVGRRIALHREIAMPAEGLVVDHINGDSLDNRRANLRVCTARDNHRNKSPRKGRPFKGVCARAGRYRAMVMVDGVQKGAGAYASEIEAAVAYDVAARTHHGEFARLNFHPSRDWLFPYAIADAAGRVA